MLLHCPWDCEQLSIVFGWPSFAFLEHDKPLCSMNKQHGYNTVHAEAAFGQQQLCST